MTNRQVPRGTEPSEALLAIKRVSPSVALILYSGHEPALEASRRASPEGLVLARLRKPFAVERLTALLDEVVAR